ncbi:hypothetical protein B0H17DRAFT_927585 [Mycena rosella]|uniref:Uncharacterized protein n=1 Tax=Mycena rosella TaxID=1033263 RepID=A0AAD7DUY2_MYCRO|nr:hypothetical protein B0H17DRAFT_927585 [Mycena rosella]
MDGRGFSDEELREGIELRDLREERDGSDAARDEGWPGPTGAVWRWNLTKVQRVLRERHFAGGGRRGS